MVGNKFTLAAIAILLAGIGTHVACDPEQPEGAAERSAVLEVTVHPVGELPMRDVPSLTPSKILLAIDTIEAHHHEHGWVAMPTRVILDLLAPEEALPGLLAAGSLPDGSYDQLRFHFQFAAVQIDRRWEPVMTTAGEQGEFKIHTPFCLVGGEVASLALEWDVSELLHHSEARGFWMDASCITVPSLPTCADDKRTP